MKLRVYKARIYRDKMPKSLSDCKSWWDVVVHQFYNNMASVTFMVDQQEETLEYEDEIEKAWLVLALNDYKEEFVVVYEYINKTTKVKEMYNKDSYLYTHSDSLINIKTKFMDKYNLGKKGFDMIMVESALLRRYIRFCFNHIYDERFKHKEKFLLYV